MIPRDYITQWRERAPWSEDFQVEQDLVISRALVKVFSDPLLAGALAFRGGTALYKLYLTPPARYSEDIDPVQVEPGPAAPLVDGLRSALDPWLGEARWKQSQGRVTFGYRSRRPDQRAGPAGRTRRQLGISRALVRDRRSCARVRVILDPGSRHLARARYRGTARDPWRRARLATRAKHRHVS